MDISMPPPGAHVVLDVKKPEKRLLPAEIEREKMEADLGEMMRREEGERDTHTHTHTDKYFLTFMGSFKSHPVREKLGELHDVGFVCVCVCVCVCVLGSE
jgi:hypothetical protein